MHNASRGPPCDSTASCICSYCNCVNVSAVVGVKAELSGASVDDVSQSEVRITSQWREVSADEKHQLRKKFDEFLRPLGLQTRLVVVEPAKSLALFFICMTLSAVTSLRDQWRTGELRDIVQSLFTWLSGTGVIVNRLSWPLTDYERCLDLFNSSQDKGQWSSGKLLQSSVIHSTAQEFTCCFLPTEMSRCGVTVP